MEGVLNVAGQDPIDGIDRAARDGSRRLVNPFERREIAWPNAHRRRAVRVVRKRLDRVDELLRVQTAQLRVARLARLDEVARAYRAHKLDRGPEATRRQRVVGAKVVVEAMRAEDDERLGHRSSAVSAVSPPPAAREACQALDASAPRSSAAAYRPTRSANAPSSSSGISRTVAVDGNSTPPAPPVLIATTMSDAL